MERGFYRFMTSTETVFRVHGLCQYLFWDIEQIYYPPATVKKQVGGVGNATKDRIREIVSKKYPEVEWANLDESDAVSVGLCYLYKAGKL
jgi:Holliday junction resolvasome RuvABC endonuclease subunit